MATYAVGQVLYRGYVDAVKGVYTVEVKLKSRHGKYVKITTEWRGLEVFTPGAEYIYTATVRDIAEFYAPTPTEALKILRDGRKLDLIIQEGVVKKIESDIEAITRVMAYELRHGDVLASAVREFSSLSATPANRSHRANRKE